MDWLDSGVKPYPQTPVAPSRPTGNTRSIIGITKSEVNETRRGKPKKPERHPGPEAEQMLIKAVEDGDLKATTRLVGEGVRPTITNYRGYNLLMISAESQREDVFKWLLKNGVNGNYRNKEGYTPLMAAAGAGCETCIDALLTNDVHVIDSHALHAIEWAAERGHWSIIKRLIKAGVNVRGDAGGVALHAAASEGQVDSILVLLDNGTNIDSTPHKYPGITALMKAADRGHLRAVQTLLERNADTEIISEEGFTAIGLAMMRKHTKIVETIESFRERRGLPRISNEVAQ